MALGDLDCLQDLSPVERQVHTVRHVHADAGSQAGVEDPDRGRAPDVEAVADVLLQKKRVFCFSNFALFICRST